MPSYAVCSALIKKASYETEEMMNVLEIHQADSENEAKGKFVTSILKDYTDVRFTNILCLKVDDLVNHEGEVVVTKNDEGQIVAVTRQDEDGQILKVIATNDKPNQNPISYAGVTVWIGDKQCTRHLTEEEYCQANFNIMEYAFNSCYELVL